MLKIFHVCITLQVFHFVRHMNVARARAKRKEAANTNSYTRNRQQKFTFFALCIPRVVLFADFVINSQT